VLKTLAGDDSRMTEIHLSDSNAQRIFKEAWERVFADPLSTPIAKNSMITMMRYLADLWINSGKSGEGENRVDNPSRRNVEYRPPPGTPLVFLKLPEHPNAFLSFWTPSEINREYPRSFGEISLDAGQSVLEIDALYKETPRLGWNAFPISSGETISELFYRLVGNEKRWPQIHKDSIQSLKELIFGFNLETFNSAYRLALHIFGTKVAMYWFAKLLDSPFSRLLARCDDCGTYFAYERAPRTDIKGGTHCRNCKGCGSAKRMNRTRDKRNDSLVRFAAEFYGQFKPNSRQPRTKWIAERVNRRTESVRAKAGKEGMSHYPAITGRWVTQHLTEIEEEVERRKHATREN
jgi:hypothetical protein